jgi:polysaccharide biosynthesis transport protein
MPRIVSLKRCASPSPEVCNMLLFQRNVRLGLCDDRRIANHPAPTMELGDIWQFVRRQRLTIAGMATISVLLAVAYILSAVPRFTAEAFVLIEPKKARQFESPARVNETGVESALVDSQVEIAQSGRVVLKVIRDLNLDRDPEFSTAIRDINDRLRSLLAYVRSTREGPSAAEGSQGDIPRHVVDAFRRNLSVRRVGLTYVLQIGFTSQDREKAALIANQVASAYVNDELSARSDDMKLAQEWMEGRSEELRAHALAAERAAQRFRAKHNIVVTARGPVDEQQLNELNTQFILARAHTAEARAKLEYIEGIVRQQDAGGVVMDALRNDVIGRLRSRLLDAQQAESELTRRFGEGNGTAVQLREEVGGLRQSIFDELNRIAEAYRGDYEVAKSREKSLASSLKELVSRSLADDEPRIVLNELQRDAHTSRNVYEAVLIRLKEAAQQQSFPITEARIITSAEAPTVTTYPRTKLLFGGALFFGAVAGFAAGLVRESLDRTFRTAQQAERETGLNCLAAVPRVGKRRLRPGAAQGRLATLSELMRSIQVAIDDARSECKIRVVGIVSTLPDEGVTTIAEGLAGVVARGGHRVLLIHADLRTCAPGGKNVGSPEPGLHDVILGRCRLQDVVRRDPDTGLSILSAGSRTVSIAGGAVASTEMREFLEHRTDDYDLIILDLPPLAVSVDGRAVAPMVDAFLLVIAWGQTSRHIVLRALSGADMVYRRTLGFILNRVDMRAMRRFDRDGAAYQLVCN